MLPLHLFGFIFLCLLPAFCVSYCIRKKDEDSVENGITKVHGCGIQGKR
jgi:hypothetical protein